MPYKAVILPLDVTNKKIMKLASEIYNELKEGSAEVLLDDRDERAGVKFKDADLIGIGLEVIIGKEYLDNGNVELKIRRGNKKIIKPKAAILKELKKLIYG